MTILYHDYTDIDIQLYCKVTNAANIHIEF